MDGWTIDFSPGGFACQATWGGNDACGWMVPSGYIIAKHPLFNEWSCLNCMIATVRQELRKNRIEEVAGA